MSIQEVRSPKEQPLYIISLVFSILVWAVLVLGTLGIGLVYVLFGVLGFLVFQALMVAAIKGNGVRISEKQLPELYARLASAAQKLGLKDVPEAYLVNDRGILNAFATRFWGRNFVILYAELVEACDQAGAGIDFVIGHEIGHHALGHLRLRGVLLPARIMPWLGPAYSRACEYSCDRAGQAVVEDPQAAITGLCVLAAGGRFAKQLSIDEYLNQQATTGHFWQAVVELNLSHPFLSKRIGALIAMREPARAQPPLGRNVFAYILAPFFALANPAAGGAGMLVVVAVIAMLAAIAIPQFMKFQQRAREQAMMQEYNRMGDTPAGLDDLRRAAGPDGQQVAPEVVEALMRQAAQQQPANDPLQAADAARVVPAEAAEEEAVPDNPPPRRGKGVKAKKHK